MSEGLLPILIVEDDEILCRLAVRQLASLGYVAQAAANGKEALKLASEQSFSLILMDVHMPIMDGLEVAQAIRQREQESNTDRIPILALTADLVADRKSCLTSGIDDFIFKPVTTDELRATLARWLPADLTVDIGEPNK